MINLVKKHKIIAFPIALISFYVLGYLFLVISYLFPAGRIQEHIKEDMYSVVAVGEWLPGHDDTVPDYYTDSLMLLEAEFDSEDSAFLASIKSPRALIPDSDYVYETFIGFNEDADQVFYEYDYFRYWHGYLIFLKPLLYFFSLGTVKYLTVLAQFVLLFLFVYMVIKSGYSFWYCIPLLASYIFMNPVTLGLSFQYNTVYVIVLCSLIILFWDNRKYKNIGDIFALYFFFIGMITSYFDLLTYPLLTFGIPVLYFFLLYSEKNQRDYFRFIGSFVSWIAGYGSLWACKWILSAAVIGRGAFSEISNSISVRSGFDASESFSGDYVSYFDVLQKNLSVQPVYGMIVVIFAVCMVFLGFLKFKNAYIKNFRNFLIICLMTGLLPFAWYFFLPNHSWIHYWFTYRTLAVSVCALVMIPLAGLYDKRS